MILDIHTHAFPGTLAVSAIEKLAGTANIPYHRDGSVQSLRDSMTEAGITHSVVCNILVKPEQASKTIGFAKELLAHAAEGPPYVLPFGSIHPDDPQWKEHLWQLKEDGFAGIKLHPDFQDFFINDPKMEKVYEEIAKTGLVVLFHTGVDLSFPDNVRASHDRIMDVLPLLERCTTVLAHMGLNDAEKPPEYCGANVYFDTSFALQRMSPELVREIVKRHSPERMIFGSDSPWTSQRQSLDCLHERLGSGFLSEQAQRQILWDNAAGILNLDEHGLRHT